MNASERRWLVLAGFVVICFAAAGIGSLLTSRSVGTWYQQLNKPPWTPPDSVFGPVWTALYLLMAVSAWLVWVRAGLAKSHTALSVFFAQLALNVLWSALFFAMRNPAAALGEIAVLWVVILATAVLFWRIRPLSGWLMLPYLLWVSFAGFLNFSIWNMNI
jgi:translocator protein